MKSDTQILLKTSSKNDNGRKEKIEKTELDGGAVLAFSTACRAEPNGPGITAQVKRQAWGNIARKINASFPLIVCTSEGVRSSGVCCNLR